MKHAFTAAAAVAAGLILYTPPAEAADIGWCGTPQELSALMQSEGQRSLASGNQYIRFEELPDGTFQQVDKEVGLIFTASEESRIGYMVRADQPIGTPATRACIANRWHNVQLFDAREPGLSPDALINSTEEDAQTACEELHRRGIVTSDSCGFHNHILERAEAVGQRVFMQGRGVERQPDGSYRTNGTIATITLILPGHGTDRNGERSPERDGRGALLYSTIQGASLIGTFFSESRYTPYALELFDAHRRNQLSALQPN